MSSVDQHASRKGRDRRLNHWATTPTKTLE